MQKKSLIFVFILVISICSNVFAFRWEKQGDDWYALNDNVPVALSNQLLNDNGFMYYTDEDGKIITGWFYNTENKKAYYFSNRPDNTIGQMVFGLKSIDGYLRYFTEDGSLAKADKEGEYKKVYLEYWADADGLLYENNILQKDISTKRSDYYTDPQYYTNLNLNNLNLRGVEVITWRTYKDVKEAVKGVIFEPEAHK